MITKFTPCRNCNKSRFKGYIQKDDKLEPCTCKLLWEKLVLKERSMIKGGFDLEYSKYDIEKDYLGNKSIEVVSRIKNYIKVFVKNNTKLNSSLSYFYGENGCQKTAVSNYLGSEIMTYENPLTGKYYKTKIILMNNLIKLLTNAERDEFSMKEVEILQKLDLLIIDESFSKDKVSIWKSGYQIPFLDSFIRNRIQRDKKAIIFISNINPDFISEEDFSKSIKDFVIRNIKLNNTSLEFKDNYLSNCNFINIEDGGLF